MGVGRGFAVSAEKDLIVANDNENHTSGAGLKEEILPRLFTPWMSGSAEGGWSCAREVAKDVTNRRAIRERGNLAGLILVCSS